MIHVCLCINDKTGRYSKFTGTTICSLFENCIVPPPSITVHILHDNTLTIDNRDKFTYLANHYGQYIKFYNVEKLCADTIVEYQKLIPELKNSWVTIGAFYRFLIPQIISIDIEKVIYLDSDIIVNLDINALWQVELDDKILGVIPEILNKPSINLLQKLFLLVKDGLVKAEDYFNSGVLLMNLRLLRDEKEHILQGIKFRGENPQHIFWDQTVWNYCFSTRTLKLEKIFNQLITNSRRIDKDNPYLEKKIYHYCAGAQGLGLGLDCSDKFNRLWMNYFIKTPWFNIEKTFDRLNMGFIQELKTLNESMLNLSTIISGKRRAFFVSPIKVKAVEEFFSVRADEIIITADNETSIQKLLNAMKIFHNKFVFFIMTETFLNNDFPFDLLIKEGFIEDKDFVKAWSLWDLSFNSYSLLKKL